jgi:hypothetical protein
MMMIGDRLRVVLVTTHLALAQVPKALSTPRVYETITMGASALQQHLGIPAPRVGVAGLNPHAGEGGLFVARIVHYSSGRPACPPPRHSMRLVRWLPTASSRMLRRAIRSGRMHVPRPGISAVQADALQRRRELHRRLPFVRTSPDHGTAYDIAGGNRADRAVWLPRCGWRHNRGGCDARHERFQPGHLSRVRHRGVSERDFDTDFARRLGQCLCPVPGRGCPCARDPGTISHWGWWRLPFDLARVLGGPARGVARSRLRRGSTWASARPPLVYFALFDLRLDGAIQVTGSHNPADQNGFKICIGQTTVHGDQIQDIRRCFDDAVANGQPGTEEQCEIVPRYQAYLGKALGRLPRPLRIVVDAGNATAGPVAPAIFRTMGCEVTELYCDMDGRFPNHHPDPTVEENLKDLKARVRVTWRGRRHRLRRRLGPSWCGQPRRTDDLGRRTDGAVRT